MRTLIATLLLLPLLATASPAGTVFKYECEKVDAAITNFTCRLDDGMKLHMLKQKKQLSQEQAKRSDYEFERIALRYMELGGKHFEVTADFWPDNAKRICSARDSGKRYLCTDCLEKNGMCEPVNK